ncbi:S8 family peptidase [Pseudoduganella sp. UC29_106]|uniref:S8 family peptidase n=1 Tax=Pseudoduganella sp. UC29_106 TaxID=3374553 RepID=UPI0037569DD1
MISKALCRRLAAVAQATLVLTAPVAYAQGNGTAATHPFGPSRPIAGQYVIVFKDSVANPAAEAENMMKGRGGKVLRTFSKAVKGFSANLPDAAAQALRNNPNVRFVEQDQTVTLNATSLENNATWGLDRIDQADRPLDLLYHYSGTGAGVTAFIVDTGIRADHTEFTGRILPGADFVGDGNGTNDCNGHGTHVAGTVGGTTWGVAKGVSIVPVRVLDCAGAASWSTVIAGMDWVAASTQRPAVANLSLGGGASEAVDAAVAGAISKGVTVVVAAGNSNADACTVSPARESDAITVGATNGLDARASYSNYGTCVDLFAPGNSITSAWNTGPTASNTIGGTSMAAPHVAGVAALVLAKNPTASPAAVASWIVTNATPNRVLAASIGPGSPNLLLFTGSETPVQQPANKVVALQSMVGNATKSGGNWKAAAVVKVRDINTGAAVANATVEGSFSAGGNASCNTDSTGTCTLSSGALKSSNTSSTTLTATGVSGTLMSYDRSQNAVSQIVIAKP